MFMDMDDIELDLASDQTFGLDSFCWISPLFFKFRRVAVVETGVPLSKLGLQQILKS